MSRRVSSGLAWGMGGVLLLGLIALDLQLARRPKRTVSKVVVGTRDEVYFSHAPWMQDAQALGQALRQTGFFRDLGATVLYSKERGVPAVSFVVHDGAWERPETAATFEEIGRRVAPLIGGFPIEVRLVDAKWNLHKSLEVGKVVTGARDVVYYLGSATEAEAKALGQALRETGYLQDLGVAVALSKNNSTVLGFVVSEGVWNRPDALAGFDHLARRVAASVGGLPVEVHLLDGQMVVQKLFVVR